MASSQVKDSWGVKIKFPTRSCKNCGNYPCFVGIDKCVSDFASYGCYLYSNRGNK